MFLFEILMKHFFRILGLTGVAIQKWSFIIPIQFELGSKFFSNYGMWDSKFFQSLFFIDPEPSPGAAKHEEKETDLRLEVPMQVS